MKIVIIGGTGFIGTKLVNILRGLGHEVIAASPSLGVNTITGEGVIEALSGAQVVVDVSNSPSYEDKAVLEFFETSTRNLLASGAATGVKHHIVLSIIGTDRLPENGYFRAKLAQEKQIAASGIPYTILRASQFFEFIDGIANSFTEGNLVRVPSASVQFLAGDDVASALVDCALGAPDNGIEELAGPERLRFDELIRLYLSAKADIRQVITDDNVRYFGALLDDRSLIPDDHLKLRIAQTRFEDWLHNLSLRGK
ncbi:SDR family oxidoreductase [Paenibacillus sp. CF384]|uniref:SDR family oxidoreductase n=1 Tax=Paenibacillus sp. CF384 TaxID=1884382 RepID=UPI0008964724|nr:SDR family oxidoreductase [Paenibacillus sp. CF384]SDW47561.1 Uncharacterized conserved protein YbjT, contains NAD(P)-binding and DUF2867 domains [Paenibacillus sp. CF384]